MESNILSKLLMMSQNIVLTTNVCRKNSQPAVEFFLFLRCILYTKLVNIIPLSGTHQKRETLGDKASQKGSLYELCSFLYIPDMTAFIGFPSSRNMYKKRTFYTYASTSK